VLVIERIDQSRSSYEKAGGEGGGGGGWAKLRAVGVEPFERGK
jgi:hypothetical protein